MATPFPTVQPGDVWGQQLINAVTGADADTLTAAGTAADTKVSAALTAAGTDAQTKATTALNSAKAYADTKLGTPALVLGPNDPIPPGTPVGTLIGRTA